MHSSFELHFISMSSLLSRHFSFKGIGEISSGVADEL